MGEIKNPAPVLPTPERDIHGKPLRKSFYSTVSLSDAKKKAEEYRVASEVSARTGEAFVPSTGRFAPWARKWLLSYKQPFVEEDTYKLTYVSLVEGHLIPYFGNALLSDIRPVDIQAYFATKTACSESRLKNCSSQMRERSSSRRRPFGNITSLSV